MLLAAHHNHLGHHGRSLLEPMSPQAMSAREMGEALLAKCDAHGRLGAADRRDVGELMRRLEAGLE